MAKLYLFGIGGTGARVIKSLTMLLAAGVPANIDAIVPVIIDPDEPNGDLTRTIDLMKIYQATRSELSFSDEHKNRFFKAPLLETVKDFRLNLWSENAQTTFQDHINFGGLDDKNKALVSLLYTQKNLSLDMKKGFKGNPNIGSIVLNEFSASTDFRTLCNDFGEGDSIFIVSSIFGGTGAAGFPLLLKNIRNIDTNIPNADRLKNAIIGTVTVLPYFGVKPDSNSEIDKSTFISKTKAALLYYEQNISKNNSLNAHYYLGDLINGDYENNEGGLGQQNDAHFIELASALSIIDFLSCKKSMQTTAGRADNPVYKEFGTESDSQELIFSNLGKGTRDLLCKPMTQFKLFSLFYQNELGDLGQTYAKEIGLQASDLSNKDFFAKSLTKFFAGYNEWLVEMSRDYAGSRRTFVPFELNMVGKPFDIVKGRAPEKSFIEFKKDYNKYKDVLNSVSTKLNKTGLSQNFMDLFYVTTEELVKEKFKF